MGCGVCTVNVYPPRVAPNEMHVEELKSLYTSSATNFYYTEGCKSGYTVIRVIQSIDVYLLLHPSV